jgi:hypothetical protein
MKSQLNLNNKIIIQIIISIVRVSEDFSKMLVLSGVFNTRILDATNYANQDYMRVNYTYSCLHYALSIQQPIEIADWSIIVQCHLLVKHGLKCLLVR